MRYFVITVMFFIALILQSTLFSHLTVAGVKPDLVLILIVFYALLQGPSEGLIVGLIGGLLQDLMFGQYIGINTLAKMTVGWVFGVLERKIYKENVLIPMLAMFVATFLNETILHFLKGVAGNTTGYLTAVRDVIVSTAVYNSCLTPFIYGRIYKSAQKGLLRIQDN